MFYGRLRFYCILSVYAKFFMFTLFLLYLVRNDNNKDDQSINYHVHSAEPTRNAVKTLAVSTTRPDQ